jgi:transcriptional regulator with XRE-family HTH domain
MRCEEVNALALTSDKGSVGKNLKRLRAARGLKQTDVARMLGVTQPHYSNVERGIRQLSLRLLVRLCEALEAEPASVLSSSGEPDEAEGKRDEVD